MGHDRPNTPLGGEDRHPDPVKDEALDWFMRLQEDRRPKTLAEFETWRAGERAREEAYEALVRMNAMPSLKRATEADAARLRLPAPSPVGGAVRAKPGTWLSAVSVMVAILLLVVAWHQYPALLRQWQAEYVTAAGGRETILLPDGSSVILNTASAIAVDFERGRRRVTLLDGEAFFDVRHDAAHPFVVAGHFSEVTVKGTAFGVRTDEQEDVVVLERGSVEVSRIANRSELAMLKPGEMVVATDMGLSAVRDTDTSRSLAWRDGRIVFHDRPFRNALDDLKRYFRGSVVVMTDRPADSLVSGNYRIDDPEAAIRTLAASAGVSVTRLPGGILILR